MNSVLQKCRNAVLHPAALDESTVGAWGANSGSLKGLWALQLAILPIHSPT
jgi:hypothetical protein